MSINQKFKKNTKNVFADFFASRIRFMKRIRIRVSKIKRIRIRNTACNTMYLFLSLFWIFVFFNAGTALRNHNRIVYEEMSSWTALT